MRPACQKWMNIDDTEELYVNKNLQHFKVSLTYFTSICTCIIKAIPVRLPRIYTCYV